MSNIMTSRDLVIIMIGFCVVLFAVYNRPKTRMKTKTKFFNASIFFIFAILAAFGIKAFIIGSDYPSADKNKFHNFLLSSIRKPTPVPVPYEIHEQTQLQLDTAQKELLYLSAELEAKKDLVQKENIKKEKIISTMNKNLGGKLKGKGNVIYEASIANKYPPFLQCAIVIHETGNGTSAAIKNLNNVGGIFNGNSLRVYKTVDAGIWDMATRIKKYYIDEGLTTIEKFGAKYCPVGTWVANDPTGLNKHWIPTVTKNYIKLLNEAGGIV